MYSFCSSLCNDFPFEEAELLYEETKKATKCTLSMKEQIERCKDNFFAGYFINEFKGIVYLHDWEQKDNKFISCFLSGFAKRKCHLHIIEAVKILCDAIIVKHDLKCIYTKPSNLAAKICDLRIGFIPYKDDILIYERKN